MATSFDSASTLEQSNLRSCTSSSATLSGPHPTMTSTSCVMPVILALRCNTLHGRQQANDISMIYTPNDVSMQISTQQIGATAGRSSSIGRRSPSSRLRSSTSLARWGSMPCKSAQWYGILSSPPCITRHSPAPSMPRQRKICHRSFCCQHCCGLCCLGLQPRLVLGSCRSCRLSGRTERFAPRRRLPRRNRCMPLPQQRP